MKYRVYNKQEEMRALFENGIDININIDFKQKKYFKVPNVKNNKVSFIFKNIKEAYTKILNGEGDYIYISPYVDNNIYVYKYIDKSYGRNIRKNTLKLFKDVEFIDCLRFCIEDNVPEYVLKDTNSVSYLSSNDNQNKMKFNNKKEIKKYIKTKIKQGKELKYEYEKLNTDDTEYLLKGDQIQSIKHLICYCLLFNIKFKFDIVPIIKNESINNKLFSYCI